MLRQEIPTLLNYVEEQKSTLGHNHQLFDIYEGDLLSYVIEELRSQLSIESFDKAKHRIAPVNILKRVIDKLSKIYSVPPNRWLEIEKKADADLFDWYQKQFDINTTMQLANEFFNLFKNCAIEPYVNNGVPALRIIPSDRFTVYSNDFIDPTRVTHFIKHAGKIKKTKTNGTQAETKKVDLFFIYTDEEFLPVDSEGDIVQEILDELNNPEGVNPYGKIPAVYINRSRHNLVPIADTDTLKMTKLFPVLLSDLNYAVMFQSFSVVYGIDVDDQNITMSPNAFWRFKSDPTTDTKPEVGMIKPQIDIESVMRFIASQIAFWLQSKNIRPGQVGDVSAENFSSGISKIVDDLDTYEDRQKQIPYFMAAETELWDLVMHYMHPVWVKESLIDERRLFLPNQKVHVEFAPQKPLVSRKDTLQEIKAEMELNLMTRRDAIMRLNPTMTEDQANEYMQEIDEANVVEIEEPQEGDIIKQAEET